MNHSELLSQLGSRASLDLLGGQESLIVRKGRGEVVSVELDGVNEKSDGGTHERTRNLMVE